MNIGGLCRATDHKGAVIDGDISHIKEVTKRFSTVTKSIVSPALTVRSLDWYPTEA